MNLQTLQLEDIKIDSPLTRNFLARHAHSLRKIDLCGGLDGYDQPPKYGWMSTRDLFGDGTWPHLESLELDSIKIDERHMTSFLKRHSALLRAIKLSNMFFEHFPQSWTGLVIQLREEMRLEEFEMGIAPRIFYDEGLGTLQCLSLGWVGEMKVEYQFNGTNKSARIWLKEALQYWLTGNARYLCWNECGKSKPEIKEMSAMYQAIQWKDLEARFSSGFLWRA